MPQHQPIKNGFRIVYFDQSLAFDHPDPCRHGPDKGTVVADQQTGCAMLDQFALQGVLPLDVEVVGRLVQQVEVRPRQPQKQHRQPRLLTAREARGGRGLGVDGNPAPASRARAGWSARSLVRFTASQGVGKASSLRQRLVGPTEPQAGRHPDVRVRSGECCPQPLDKPGLAGAVGPKQGHPVAVFDPELPGAEQQPTIGSRDRRVLNLTSALAWLPLLVRRIAPAECS